MMTEYQAVVLAGGEGTRLRPLTKYQPKPMLPVANRPVLEYVFDALLDAGLTNAVVVVGYGDDRVRERFGNSYRGLELTYVPQKVQLGSGHALLQAREHVGSKLLVVNGDNIVDAAVVEKTVEQFEASDAAASVAVASSDTPEEYGAVFTENGTITTIIEHPSDAAGYRINAGVYMFTDAIFDALDRTETRDGELYITDALADLPGKVLAAEVPGVWFDPSYPWDILSVTETLLSAHTELVADEFTDTVLVDDSAHVHETATIEGPAVVGPDCELGAGSVISAGTCLGQNTRVETNSVIERSTIGPDARIGANAVLRDCLVGTGATVGDGVVAPSGQVDVLVNDRMHRNKRLGSIIADRANVGANATLEPGVRIGPSATIGVGITARGEIAEDAEVVS